jgi:hypothetical protein
MIMPAVISTVLALAPPTDVAPPDFIDGGGDGLHMRASVGYPRERL